MSVPGSYWLKRTVSLRRSVQWMSSCVASRWFLGSKIKIRSLQTGRRLLSGNGLCPGTIAISIVPFRSALMRRIRDRSTVASSTWGARCLNSTRLALRFPAEIDVQKPTERRPESPLPLDWPVTTSMSTCSRIIRDIRRMRRPARVRTTPPCDRLNNVTPTKCSSWPIERLSKE